MRTFTAVLIVALGLGLGLGVAASAQTACTGLCLEQTTCSGNATTSISGTVYAPNGTDPLPNVAVYIPNSPVDPFTPGVDCPLVGTPPSGSPLVGTTTDVKGNFTLTNVPVGSNIPLVIVSGRWRRQLVVPGTAACVNTPMPASFAVMPQSHTQGDIPLIAVATGSADQAECVLLKMGISQSEFTDPGGGGRINLYGGGTLGKGGGAIVGLTTPSQDTLMGNAPILNQYDALMLPCEGSAYTKPAQELANLLNYANIGGRVYASHFSYAWMYTNPPFDGVAHWTGASVTPSPSSGTATIDTSFTDGQTLSTWLQNVGASISPGQMELNTLRIDQTGVIAPTQSWLTLNDSVYGNPVMQFVFDTPIAPAGQTVNQCGRVLFNEYHVENPLNGSSVPSGTIFPGECNTSAAMTPQEKLLEYMLFELTDEGEQPSIAPTSQDFGQVVISYSSAPQTFAWTNNSIFPATVSSVTINGSTDFTITANNCGAVASGASCQITVVFTPTALGARAGTLTVVSSGTSLNAPLTGTGIAGFSLAPRSLSFGSLDVGASATQTLQLTSLAPVALALPPFVTTGEYAVSTAACPNPLPSLAICTINVTFNPTTTGPQNGTVGVSSSSLLYNGLNATLSGNGIDFTISLSPTGGTVIAGDGTTTTATLTPLAGFSAPISLNCPAPAGAGVGVAAPSCILSTATITGGVAATSLVSFTTTSQYTVIGYGGFGGRGSLWLIALASGWLLWRRRRIGRALLWGGLLVLMLGAMGLSLTGCTGKLPNQNPSWTAPGNYIVTVTATDGFLVHSATYSLTVLAK